MMSDSREAELAKNLEQVQGEIAQAAKLTDRTREDISLVVVTKTYPVADLEILYRLGVRDFGENRDQEARTKVEYLPDDVRWHFQGQIQSNKINSITTWASVIHSVDRVDHYEKIINRMSSFAESPTSEILIQINLDEPEDRAGRGGVPLEKVSDFLNYEIFARVKPAGVMAVAPLEGDAGAHFARLVKVAHQLHNESKVGPIISAGMSSDFAVAIKAGATLVRVGSSILGNRTYSN